MASIDLNKGNKFTLTRIGNKTAITDASDHVHATKHFRNQVIISGSEFSGLTANSPAFAVKGNQSRVVLIEADDLANIQPMLELKHTSTTQNHHLTQYFNHTSADWAMGIVHGSTGGQDDNGYFIISNNSNISVDSDRAIMLDLAENVYIPNGGLVVGGANDGSESDPGDGVLITKGSGTSIGAGVDSSAINTVNIGKSGDSGTGINIINIYGEGDGYDGQSANEIRFHGHEGRAQGLVFMDEDYADKNWFIGTPYQGNSNFFTIGYDDDTEYHPRRRAAIFSVQGPDEGNNGGNGSIRVQDWDDSSGGDFTTHYFWVQHNGVDARLGACVGHFDFHNEGDEDSGTHFVRFDSTGAVFMYNLTSEASTNGLRYNTSTGQLVYVTSTKNIKKNIELIDNSNDINKLESVSYKYKDGSGDEIGFIAEQVAEVNPIFATYGPDYEYDENGKKIENGLNSENKKIYKLKSDKQVPIDINDRAILSSAIKKIQELEARIAELENK